MSIFSSTQHPFNISGENGTKLYDAANNVKLAEIKEGGSTTFRLKKKLSDRTVIAKKEGYKNTPFVIESAFNAKALWNILFWPGFLIDLGTGKINKYDPVIYVSIRPTTGIKPLYTTIATVTMNLIVSAAIVLLNPYVTVYISYKIPPFALSVHIPDVSTSIYVEVDSKVLLGLPSCDKAFVR